MEGHLAGFSSSLFPRREPDSVRLFQRGTIRLDECTFQIKVKGHIFRRGGQIEFDFDYVY
jgi:hypothetical protein